MSAVEAELGEIETVPFVSRIETVSEYVRYELVRRSLGTLAAETPLRVLAVGPESGLDALWLHSKGHQVTIVDQNKNRLGQAGRRLGKWAPEVADTMDLDPRPLESLLSANPGKPYDLALCHMAAMYEPQPGMFIYNVGHLVRPCGNLSVLERGFVGTVISMNGQKRYKAVDMLYRRDQTHESSGKAWAFKPRWLTHTLRDAGAYGFDWTGVGVTSGLDMRQPVNLSGEKLNAIVDEQDRLGQNRNLRAAAPLLHFVGRIGAAPTSRVDL